MNLIKKESLKIVKESDLGIADKEVEELARELHRILQIERESSFDRLAYSSQKLYRIEARYVLKNFTRKDKK